MEGKKNKREKGGMATLWAAQLGAGGLLLRRHVALVAAAAALGLALIALKKRKKKAEKPAEPEEKDEQVLVAVREGIAEKDFKIPQPKHLTEEGRSEEETHPPQHSPLPSHDLAPAAPSLGDAFCSVSSKREMKHAKFKVEKQPLQVRTPEKIVEEERGVQAGEAEPKTIEVVEEEAREAIPPEKEEDDGVNASFIKEAVKPSCPPRADDDQEMRKREKEKRRERGLVGEIMASKNSWNKLLLWLSVFLVSLVGTFLCLNYRLHLRQSSSL